jgi:hypothetical protein
MEGGKEGGREGGRKEERKGRKFPRKMLSVANASFFFLVGLDFELRASHFQSRYSSASATLSVHFALVIFEDGVL